MSTLEAWIKEREHVNIDTLASEDRSCGICYKHYKNPGTKGVETDIKDTENEIEARETCIAPIKLSCGHIMGSTCLLKWLKPYPFGTCPPQVYSLYLGKV